MTDNMFDWHLLVPDVYALEEEFLFVLLLFWICFFFFVFSFQFVLCLCVCLFICMRFPQNNINTSFHTSSFWHLWCSDLIVHLLCGRRWSVNVCVCVCCASVVRQTTLSKDFSLIIGYLIATFAFKFGPLNIVMCCFHTCAGSHSRGSYILSGSLECEAVINVLRLNSLRSDHGTDTSFILSNPKNKE